MLNLVYGPAEPSGGTYEDAKAHLSPRAVAAVGHPGGPAEQRPAPAGRGRWGQATQVVSQGRHHHSFLRLVRVPSFSGL